MVVDDEESLLKTLKMVFGALGWEAAFAREGREALTIYNDARRQNRPFDAVLLDLTMPAGMMGGEEAVKELKKIDPQVKAVATSGDPTYPAMENYQQFGFCARIVKPYDIEELKNLLEQVTNRKEGV